MNVRNYDKELEELKKEIKSIVGEKELTRIMEIVNVSYSLDKKPEIKTEYKINE